MSSLRISNVGLGREHVKGRVHYFFDPREATGLKAAPESVVLKRWRQRSLDGYTFSGARLSSTIWRAMAFIWMDQLNVLARMTPEEIAVAVETEKDTLKKAGFLKLPNEKVIYAMVKVCGVTKLRKILNRHTSKEHEGLSGVPDLFLFATENKTGRPCMAHFVEVKKPEEKMRQAQVSEIPFLKGLGLDARVFRFKEPKFPVGQMKQPDQRP